MLNRTGEWFGHIAVQVAIWVTFATFQQVASARDVLPLPPPAQHTRVGVAGGNQHPLRGPGAPLLNMVPPWSNLPQAGVAPSLLAQIAPNSPALAKNASTQAAVQSPKPVNETIRPAAGAKPSGQSVRPHRFRPRAQSADNPADPYIVAQAAALNNDPNQIFAFVRDQIGFQVYTGSLRGARGTLWNNAGNSLDRASLLVALLGAAGVSSRYVEGTLPPALQQQLVLSMFSNAYQLTGCPPPGSQFANPGSDPSLLGIVSDHFWVEFGPAFTPADPNFPNAQIGTVNGTATNRFTTIPAALQHTVTFRLDIEEYAQASALFGLGDGISTTEVLNQTFATTDLVGEPVTLANLVSGSSGGFVFGATTFTYSPYLRFGADPTNPSADTLITGQEYQETYTNFPLGNEILTGIFLNMDVNDPGSATQTYQRAMLDRIGYAARQNGTSVSIAAPATPTSAITPVDMMSVNVLGGYQDPAQNAQYATAQLALDARMTAQSSSPVLQTEVDKLSSLGRAEVTFFASQSDLLTSSLAEKYFVAAYQSSPRLLLFKTSIATDSQGNSTISFAIDLRKDDVKVVAPPQQVTTAPAIFNVGRGIFENELESQLASAIGASIPNGATVSYSTASIFAAAQQQNIPFVVIQSQNASLLNTLSLSADALARISNAIQSGLTVATPTQAVTLNGVTTVGWYQFNSTTGETVGVLEDGGNQGIVEAAMLYASVSLYNALVFGLGLKLPPWSNLNANQVNLFKTATGVLAGAGGVGLLGLLILCFSYIPGVLPIALGIIVAALILLTLAVLLFAAFFFTFSSSSSPSKDVPTKLAKPKDLTSGTPPFPVPPIIMNLGTYQAVTAGAATGLTASLSADPNFTVPLNSSPSSPELPLAYIAQVENTGGAGAQFNLTIPSAPSGFTVESSGPSLLIPAGATGQIEVCFVPSGGSVPAAGTNESFSVTATASSPSSVNASANGSFVTPAVQALSITASPTSVSPTPGSGANVSVQIQSIGNESVIASLASNPSSGLSESGLGSSVTIAPGQSSIQNLVLTPASNATIGAPLTDTITATFGNPAATVATLISITPTAAQAQAAAQGSQNASALGRTDIAITLSGLSGAINSAISACSPAAQAEVVAYVNNLIAEMNAPFLANFVAAFQADVAAISSATCANIGAALTQLSNDLANLATVLTSPAAFPFNLALQPNSAVAEPASPTNFLVALQNNSTTTNTYNLSLGSLPSGVTGSLNTSSVTLAPGASIPVNGALNNPGVTLTPSTSTAFQFSLNASINGVSGSTQTAFGTMTARSTFLAVQDVIATPGFTNTGGSVDVTTHIANIVNQNKTVQVTLVVNNSSSVQVLGPFTETVPLSVSTLLTTVDFGQINTTGLANGNYTLAVSVIDPLTSTVMPGGTGTGNLLIGSPVTATLAVAPQTLAPGNGTVTSTLTVSATASSGSGGSGTGSLIPIGSPLTFGGTNAPDTYTATTTFSSTPVLVDSGALTIWQQQVPTGPNGEWDIFYMQTTSGGPLANDINGYWNVVMNYQLSAAVNFDQVVNQWLVNGTPVSPLTNGIGSICCALASNPILPGEAYYGNGFTGPLPAGTQTNWQQVFVTPYSLITDGGINPNTANEFIFALHFTRQVATGVQYTAAVEIANNANAAYNASSFSTAPTSITPGSGADTVTWVNPASNAITWTSNVTGIQPAQVLPIDLGGTVNFTVTAGSGTVTLPQVDINSGQILGLSPGTQTVAPGQLAPYSLTVNNPTNAPITYNLAVTGISQTWVTLQSSVTVPATGSMTIPLNLRSTLADIAGTYNFMVLATSGGTSGSVEGTMILAGTGAIGAVGSSNNLGVLTALTPTQATGGQGTPATFTVQLTNTGNVADTYTLSANTPAGVTATFAQSSIAAPPGLGNFRQTLVTVTAVQGTPVGPQNFTITATSQTNAQIQGAATGTLNVVSQGVGLSISPASVNPGGTLHLTVTNLGTVTDTFALALGGPAAVISSLAVSSVTLAPNQSQQIPIAVGAAPFAALGSLGLVATATGGVTGTATATVVIPSSLGVSAAFNPTRTSLTKPGPATLLLQIQNTGSIDDTYVATIVSTSGPITASLVDITGQSVQTTSPFILPGTAQGELVVNAILTGTTDGTVTVKVTSQTNAAITATAVGVPGIGNSVPVAIAGKNRNAPTGRYTSLDGGQSYDPDENRLTYAWTVVSKPAGSALTTATLGDASTPQPFFLADVNGAYTLQLIVNNGSVNSAPSTVQITAFTSLIPPNANAGTAANALRGSPVMLNGSASNDPSQTGLALTYSWTVQSAPAGSALGGAQIGGNTPTPSFTPDADGAFTIGLQVSDADGSGLDAVTITAFNPSVPPNAVAGANRRILLNTPITVDGSASNDPGNSQTLAYQWSFVSASLSNAALLNASGAQVAFAPAAPGFYVLRLDVSNGATSSFGETTVMAAKSCDANADGVINQADFDLMTALLGSAAQPNDPLDVNGDGLITSADILLCKGQGAPVGQPNLYVTPPYLVFQYTRGGPLPAAQALTISSDGITGFTIPNPSFSWITVNPQSGTTPGSVNVGINPAGLVAGPYLGQLLPVANGYNSPAPVRVELTVLDPPMFIITPGSLTFTYQSGGAAPPPQTVELQASGQNANFSAAVSGATWLSVNPSSGMTPKPLVFTATPSPGMAPGTYTATVTFSSPSAPSQSIVVTLIVTAAPPTVNASAIVNAASDIGGPVAPGEIIFVGGAGFAVAGTNLTPPSGPIPVELGSTQVFFDNTAAPLLLVQPGLLKAIVPYEIAGQTSTQVRVVYSGVSSQVATLLVAVSNPGVFTTATTGIGQVLAVNSDETLNSATNPAARGSVLTFYETGEGQTIPPGVDGAIASTIATAAGGKAPPVPAQKVTVTIGGQPAVVTYAGGAPGFPAGLMQVNVAIPETAPTGAPIAVVITVGPNQSQTGATIFVN